MRPEKIHDLLVGAVPPLPEPPDRMAQVRRRVVRARGLRVSASVLAAVAVIGGAALGAHALAPASLSGANTAGSAPSTPAPASSDGPKPSSLPSSPSPQPANRIGVGECPQSLDLMTVPSGIGATVHAPLRNVTVCRYRHGAFDLSNGDADLLAGPKQGTSDVFVPAIHDFLDTPLPASGCRLPQPTQNISVDVVYAVDAQGEALGYIIMRTTCTAGGDPPGDKKLTTAIDQLLGPPY